MEELGCRLVGVADGDEVDVAAGDEGGVGIGILIDADGEDDEVGIGRGGAGAEKAVPRCRAAHQVAQKLSSDDFAAVVGEMDGAGAVGDGEVWGGLAGLCGMGAAVAGGDQSQREEREG